MHYVSDSLSLNAVIVVFAAYAFQLDAFHPILIKYESEHDKVVNSFRFLTIAVALFEACRNVVFSILLEISMYRMFRNCIGFMLKESYCTPIEFISSRNRMESVYRHLQIILISMDGFHGCAACSLNFTGLITGVVCNFFTIRLFSILPIWLYLVFPSAASTTHALMYLKLPCLQYIPDGSGDVLRKMQMYSTLLPKRSRVIVQRRIRSLPVLRLYAEVGGVKVHRFGRSSKSAYIVYVMTYTINLLLFVGQDAIQSWGKMYLSP